MKTFIAFLFLITLLITVHEGGHLIAAKIFNVYCTEFSIGMGPELFRKKNKETDFVVRLLPLGGFCSMVGEPEDGIEKRYNINVPVERTINGIAKWKQLIIFLAGVTMNFILGFVVLVIAFMLIKVDGVNINFINALSNATYSFKVYSTAVIEGIKSLFSDPTQVTGVIGMYSYTGEYIEAGIVYYLKYLALISINLGLMNLLPLPVLDGGRVVVLIIEMIIGHEINEKLKTKVMLACTMFLILFMVWVTGLDIYRLIIK
jgi:regulator of sigma E protease